MLTGIWKVAARLDDETHQPQNGGMGGIEQIVDRFVQTIDRQGVLDQVVGADRQKVHAACNRPRRQRRSRNLDHGADRQRVVIAKSLAVELTLELVNEREHGVQLVDTGDERQHQAHGADR